MNVTTQHAAGGLSVAGIELTNPNREFDAAYIDRACKAHPKLVQVLKAVRDLIQDDRHIPLFLVEMALLEAGEPV